jgi:hypothetical protein
VSADVGAGVEFVAVLGSSLPAAVTVNAHEGRDHSVIPADAGGFLFVPYKPTLVLPT